MATETRHIAASRPELGAQSNWYPLFGDISPQLPPSLQKLIVLTDS